MWIEDGCWEKKVKEREKLMMIWWRKKGKKWGVFIGIRPLWPPFLPPAQELMIALRFPATSAAVLGDQLIWFFLQYRLVLQKNVNFAVKWVWMPHPLIVYRFNCRRKKMAHFKKRSFTLAFIFGDICIVIRLVELARITFQRLILIALFFSLNAF